MSTKYVPYDALDDDPDNVVPDRINVAIVGVTRKGVFQYYVLPELMCYLDYFKFCNPFGLYSSPESLVLTDVSYRFNIYTVDREHEDEYLKHLEPYKRSCKRLHEELLMCLNQEERLDYYPTILMDFDKREFVSYFPEPKSFELYVPDGWTADYRPIEVDDFPPDKLFWVMPDGSDLLREEF